MCCVCLEAASGEYYYYLAFDYGGGLEKGRKEGRKEGLPTTSHRPAAGRASSMRPQVHTPVPASHFEE